MAKKQIITTAATMELTGLRERTVQRYCQDGTFRAVKEGRSWLIEKTSVNEYIKQRKKAERERIRKAAKKAKEAPKAEKKTVIKKTAKQPKKAPKQGKKGRK
jgi:excisionase family DNA binding protein